MPGGTAAIAGPCQLVDRAVRGDCGCRLRGRGILRRLQVRLHEVLLLAMADYLSLLLGQLVVESPAALDGWDLVLRVRASDLIRPLHLFGLDHESAYLLLTVLSRSERDDEVGAFLAVGLQLALLGVHSELLSRVSSEMRRELSILLHVVGEAERDTRCLMQWRLDHDDVVHLGLESLKDGVEFPAAATALVDDEFDLRLEGSERLEPQVEQDGLLGR